MVSNEEDEYYSSNESEDVYQRNDMETDSGEEDQTRDIYKTRSGRTVKPPERLTYDAHACLLTQDDHEELDSWAEGDTGRNTF